ncbi:hypothetical protein Acsp06_39750 [Actinomycetospora sp. NBRC 106375]|uniref:helix-turn-helix domain-containing protein n=1 Tax=Actinomycetospora sp. NBRC 106375 TaxID=3032207 RepID=UPI0024A35363|nr:helix-turn-helix domain-containing protein [Actinomycetospora sp. NBRC 106375]GLZ47790.1 hypothetical protein Acsp06_39750 [Actinomycetospora sp. NBRC 106375]
MPDTTTAVVDDPRAARRRERAQLARYLVERYAAGESLMRLSEDTGRSFGHVRKLLLDAGVTLRPRGGSRLRTT